MFPGTLASTGGDEVNEACYTSDPIVSKALQAKNWTVSDALAEFVGKEHDVIKGQGKTPVVWEEMVVSYDLGLPKDTSALRPRV